MTIYFQTVLNSWKNNVSSIFFGVFSIILSFINPAYASEPKPWQMDLQEPAGIIATKATDLHDFLLITFLSKNGINEGVVNGRSGILYLAEGKCTKRKLPLKTINSDGVFTLP